MDPRVQHHLWTRIISLSVALLVAGLTIWPLGYSILASLEHFSTFEFSQALQSRLWFTIWQSVLTVVVSMCIGGGLAVIEHTLRAQPRRWFIVAMTLPIFMPSIIVALGFVAVWGNAGYVNDILQWLSIKRVSFLYSTGAIVASHAFYNIPLAYLAIHLRLRAADIHLEDSARILGAPLWQRFITVTLPRLRSSIIGVSCIIFLYAFMSFALPLILGGIHYQTIEVYIYSLITQRYDFATAVVIAVLQFGFLASIIFISARWIKDIQETRISVADSQIHSRSWMVTFSQSLLALYVILPILAVCVRGMSIEGWSLLYRSNFIEAWLRTSWLAIITLILTLGMAITLVFLQSRWQKTLLLILAVSPITLGLAWRLLFGQQLWILPLAYATLLLPFAVYSLRTLWAARPPDFINTITILGGTTIHQLKATLRWLLPACIQLTALVVVFVFGDIAVASILAPYNEPTAMLVAYNLVGSYRFSIAAAGMSAVILSIALYLSGIFLVPYLYESHH